MHLTEELIISGLKLVLGSHRRGRNMIRHQYAHKRMCTHTYTHTALRGGKMSGLQAEMAIKIIKS